MPFCLSRAICALLAFASATSALADTAVTPATEYRDRIKVAQTVQPTGDTPFGESVNLYKGGLSFQQTDISFPGIGPTITLSRSYEVGGGMARFYISSEMSDWSLSVPRIKTIVPGDRFANVGKWQVNGSDPNARCSDFKAVSVLPYTQLGQHWWNGYEMRTPDGNSQPLLKRTGENTLAPDAGDYHIVTAGNWMIRCISPLANAEPGEGFIAVSPDGTEYRFDYLVYGPAIESLFLEMETETAYLPRKEAYLYVTQIKDRFGNTIDYSYTNGRLTGITGSDLRQVTIDWRTDRPVVDHITIQPGTAEAQVWNYEYAAGPTGALTRVVLPHAASDPSPPAWTFAMNNVNALEPDAGDGQEECGQRLGSPYQQSAGAGSYRATARITHPSGLIGDFDIAQVALTRAAVPTTCGTGSPSYEAIPTFYISQSLVQKTFSGPGMTAQQWKYRYAPGAPSSATECPPATCQTNSWVEVTTPDNSTTRYIFRSVWDAKEGKLLQTISGLASMNQTTPVGLRTETITYAPSTQGPFPTRYGDNLDNNGGTVNEGPIESMMPQNGATIVQQGVTFSRSIGSFDAYGNPLSITRASSGNAGGNSSRTETLGYRHDTAHWVLGLPTTTTDAGSGAVVSQATYNTTLNLPTERYSFGLLQQTLAYNSDGTLASVKDPANHETTLGSWYRGVPRVISFPTGANLSATVDSAGKLTSTTDELTSTTGYGYDAAGRLASIAYPSGDTVAWNALARALMPVASAEYGIPAGHWKQTVQTGNGKTTTFYDARWQPVLLLSEDTALGTSRSFVVQRFDGLGRQTFKSYPVGSATVDDALPGISTEYDLLGRVSAVKQNSELAGDVLTASTEYLTGFQTRVTNARSYATTTSYQVFDAPSTDAPVRVEAPEGVTTVIVRDSFGAPLSITRSGPGN